MPGMTPPLTGGCACGAIRYESSAEPILMLHCHCRDCQRSSGGAYTSFTVVPAEAFKILQGTVKYYDTPSTAGGHTHRGFCPDCGSPVVGKTDGAPQIAAIRTTSLDDPSGFTLQMDVWTCDANPWDEMAPTVPKFEKYPG